MRTIVAMSVSAIFVGVMALGCGPSQEQLQDQQNCMSRCGLELMNCLESENCVDDVGQIIPCEARCKEKRAECEQSCPG